MSYLSIRNVLNFFTLNNAILSVKFSKLWENIESELLKIRENPALINIKCLNKILRRIKIASLLSNHLQPDRICSLIGFNMHSSTEYNALIANTFLIPLTNFLYKYHYVNQAERLNHTMLTVHGHRLMSEELFANYVEKWAGAATKCGKKHSTKLKLSDNKPLKIAFIAKGPSIDNAALNHIIPLVRFINKHPEQYKACLYIMDGDSEELRSLCDIKFIDDPNETWEAETSYIKLKACLIKDDVQIACYTHAIDSVYFLFGMRIAPIQIHFSQYLHPIPPDSEIDAFMTWGTPALKLQKFGKYYWRTIPPALGFEPTRVEKNSITEIKHTLNLKGKIVLASFARVEKINQPLFLSTVSSLLKKHPNAVFLWTGQMEYSEIVNFFIANGVQNQTKFIGWVDTRTYAKVIDIFLDSFPLANGITAIYAMLEGIPVVSIWQDTSLLGRDILPFFDPAALTERKIVMELKNLFACKENSLICKSNEDYIALADKLITNPLIRKEAGMKFTTLAHSLYLNEDLMGEIFLEHINDILTRAKKP